MSKGATSTLAKHLAATPELQLVCNDGKISWEKLHGSHGNGSGGNHSHRQHVWVQRCESGESREVHLYDFNRTSSGSSKSMTPEEYAREERRWMGVQYAEGGERAKKSGGSHYLPGLGAAMEYTPNYMYSPLVPGRVRATFRLMGGSAMVPVA